VKEREIRRGSDPVRREAADMSSVWVILPTYNEAENLGPLVEQLLGVLASAGINHHVLVVDDGSPDGTGAIADRLAAIHTAVEVIHRKRKDGLGQAYLAGFDRALQGSADLVVEMDADFSHNPCDVPRLVDAAQEADVVLGSRYAPGGGVRDWSALRRIVSRAGCWYARTMLGESVHDLTGGFKCMRRPVIEHIRTVVTHSSGYCFQIEWTYRAVRAGFRVREVPIVFSERRAGHSKMSPRIALEATWRVPALRAARGSPVDSNGLSPDEGLADPRSGRPTPA
jgi:dolichol-phosphate mannosyltransferase